MSLNNPSDRNASLIGRPVSICVGFTLWKKPIVRTFLSALGSRSTFVRRAEDAVSLATERGGQVIVWASEEDDGLSALCADRGVPLIRMEDGFIRSVGLGSDFSWPFSIVLDGNGIYYDPDRPSDLEEILGSEAFSPELLQQARALRELIVRSAVTKYAVGGRTPDLETPPKNRRSILVPGQVEVDASVRHGGCGIYTNLELLRAVRRANPDAYILFKPHPDVWRGNRPGGVSHDDIAGLADQQVGGMEIAALFDIVDEIHTLTSLAGFEALLRGKQVHVYGGPFYAGWGLTSDRVEFPRRGRELQLDELVAGVLIRYPAYFDWLERALCGPETVLLRLRSHSLPLWMRARSRLYFLIREVTKALGLVGAIRWINRRI